MSEKKEKNIKGAVEDLRYYIQRICEGTAMPEEMAIFPTVADALTDTIKDLRILIQRICKGEATPEEIAVLPDAAGALTFTAGIIYAAFGRYAGIKEDEN